MKIKTMKMRTVVGIMYGIMTVFYIRTSNPRRKGVMCINQKVVMKTTKIKITVRLM